ncbi:MAG: UDP-glucose 4-epimerase GalE [Gemmataceae bacterium]|nr:UDP-glucose 4-epimerase GalE [Gemmataceae bacterium]MCS7271403.1 UDP-glucose 4-epimerase GalE [Gemmataceae bacterium]MDW8241948.1 UDP-glucose 4-epimerase GalE [Thermogemmata sp.]
MRVLVTGGAGYVGSFTVRRLLQHGHTVTVFDNLSTGHRQAVPPECLVEGDLRDADQIDQLLIVQRVEAVIHFAALCQVAESVREPARYYVNNVLYGLQLLERCRRNGVGIFIFSSSCAVYGVPPQVPIPEDAPLVPIQPYGRTKLAFEYALADYATAYGMAAVALRYFNAAGAAPDGSMGEDHEPESHLIPRVLRTALGQQASVDIYGTDYPTPDGTCVRDYVHVEDLAAAHVLALEKAVAGRLIAYNVGLGQGYSVRQVIATAEQVTGQRLKVREQPRRGGDPPVLIADNQRIRQEWGWQPQYTQLYDIIATAWEWHRRHPHGYGR